MKIKLINEERGVAAIKYKDVIEEMCYFLNNYVRRYVKENDVHDGDEISVEMPKYLTLYIDFIDKNNFKINVDIVFHDASIGYGYGNAGMSSNSTITQDSTLDNGFINVKCYANTFGFIYEKTFYNTLYHELNHLYEAYSQSKNNGGKLKGTKYESSDISRKLGNISNDINYYLKEKCGITNSDVADFFNYILYSIWSDTEKNAFISSVYGDLKSIHSVRENFQEDIKRTEAYKRYVEINEASDDIFEVDDPMAECIMLAFIKNGVNIGKTTASFKKNFYSLTKKKLKEFMNGIGRAASLYYDTTEDAKNIAESYSKTHGSCNIEGYVIEVKPEFNREIFENFKRLSGLCD